MGQDLIDRSWGGDSARAAADEARAENVLLRARARRWKRLATDLRKRLIVVRRIATAPVAALARDTAFPEEQACSFCGRARADVGALVAGAGVSICDRCSVEAVRVVADECGFPEDARRPLTAALGACTPRVRLKADVPDVRVERRVRRKART